MLKINEHPRMNASKYILSAWKRHGYVSMLIDGWQGRGKTSFALNVLGDIYNDDFETIRKVFFFEEDPLRFLTKFQELTDTYDRVPVCLIDDAGNALLKYLWQTATSQLISKAVNLIRDNTACLICTTVQKTDLLKYVREKFQFSIRLEPQYNILDAEISPKHCWTIATGYETHFNPDDTSWQSVAFRDRYNLWWPDEWRDWHQASRKAVHNVISQGVKDEIAKLIEKKNKKQEKVGNVRKVREPVLTPEYQEALAKIVGSN